MKYLFIAAMVWLSIPALAQEKQVFPADQLKEDFLIMKGSLEDFHPGLYWYRSKQEINTVFEVAAAKLNQPMNEHEYLRVLGSVISKIGCGHTQLRTQKDFSEQTNYFPLSVILLNNKLYATQSGENEINAGNEIIRINHLETDSLIQIFRESHWTEGLSNAWSDSELSRYFKYVYAIFVGNQDKYLIEYLDDEGNPKEVVLETQDITTSSIVDYTFSDNLELSFRSVESISVALLDINAFFDWRKDGKKYRFSKELRKAFNRIDSSQTEHLIIDLRDNGGGRAPFNLFSYLYDSSFIFFERMDFIVEKSSEYARYCEPALSKIWITGQAKKSNQVNDSVYQLKNEPMLKVQKPSKPQFNGKLYILINGGTFSAASDLAALVKSNDLATFVGTETGGGYHGNTSMENAWVTLPNTKVKVKIPLVRHFLPVEDKIPLGHGVIPDHEVEQTIADLINGVDTQMEFALKLLKETYP